MNGLDLRPSCFVHQPEKSRASVRLRQPALSECTLQCSTAWGELLKRIPHATWAGVRPPEECRLTVGDGFVGLRSERGVSGCRGSPKMARTLTVRYGSTRFVTSPTRTGSQEVDGSIPFSSTILLRGNSSDYRPSLRCHQRLRRVGRRDTKASSPAHLLARMLGSWP